MQKLYLKYHKALLKSTYSDLRENYTTFFPVKKFQFPGT